VCVCVCVRERRKKRSGQSQNATRTQARHATAVKTTGKKGKPREKLVATCHKRQQRERGGKRKEKGR
jgi:hypothetical protein